jgi:hypothetical protein
VFIILYATCFGLLLGHHQAYTGCLQKNGAVSKINNKFISHLTRAKRTPSAAATVQMYIGVSVPKLLWCCFSGRRKAGGVEKYICVSFMRV